MGIDTMITFLGHLEHILGGHIHSVAAILKMADNTLKATHLARLSYIFGKLRHVAIRKYMIEIAPKYGTDRSKSGTRLKD